MPYEPSKNPDPEEWLALDESERIELVRAFHRREKIRPPNLQAHAVIHTIVETQLAEDFSVLRATLARLQSEGLDRHDAVHAIASVLLDKVQDIREGIIPAGQDPNLPYIKALEELTAEAWLRSG